MSSGALEPRGASLLAPQKGPQPNRLTRIFTAGPRLDEPLSAHWTRPWYHVLWLTGLDYFSTLAYQPGIALIAAGSLSPPATVLIVLLTLLGALPIYLGVASRSYAGMGSIALLENLLEGWRGKLLVLILLGFATTGFILTITISASDAARHAAGNPWLGAPLAGQELLLTLLLIAALAGAFWGGFRKATGWGMAVGLPYAFLNLVLIARAMVEIGMHPELWSRWQAGLGLRGDPLALFVATAVVFPKLALGLSGFETSVSVMPRVSGDAADATGPYPHGRIRATRKMMIALALTMSVFLLCSSLVVTLLVSPADYQEGGPAAGRALSFLAHRLLGPALGTLYDLSTISILWLAGATAMVGMMNLIPRYLPRFGMAPHWISFRRPLVLSIFVVSAVIAVAFRADVYAQGSVYATGVLALMHAGAVAMAISLWRRWRDERGTARLRTLGKVAYFAVVIAVFTYALVDTIVSDADGVLLSLGFAAAIILFGVASRMWRATELRVLELQFADDASRALWQEMIGKKVHAAPLRTSSRRARRQKAQEIQRYYWAEGRFAFIHVDLVDNRSDFLTPIKVAVRREDDDYVVEVTGAVAIANTIAYISERIDPISIFLGLTQENLMSQSFKFLLWGEGEVGLMVYMILLRYWAWTTGEEDVRPNIFLMSA